MKTPAQPSEERARVLARIEDWRRRPHRLTDDVITSAHGAGGKASHALLQAVIAPAFELTGPALDGAVFDIPTGSRAVITTDSFVVTPRTFPGGSIGELAVNGTVNDLAVMGAEPRWLTVAFVIEEGLPIDEFRDIVAALAAAAARAGVSIVSGDTKVVGRGAADGLYVTTTGVGVLACDRTLSPAIVQPGDAIIVSGDIGDHGIAIVMARGELEFSSPVNSDSAAIHRATHALLACGAEVRWMRDPTRGGVASALNELALDTELGVRLQEDHIPVKAAVAGTCELLGLDPLYVANEGKFLAVVAPHSVEAALAALHRVPESKDARLIGRITDQHPGIVVLETLFGGTRIVDMLVGDPLPRIC